MSSQNCLKDEEKASCFAIVVLQMYFTSIALWFFLTVPWVGRKYVIVVVPDQTHLLFGNSVTHL